MVQETKEQTELEAEIKAQAQKFLTYLNSTLPESMELEYEGFYRRGFFVSKKRYAVIEDGEIIAKGLELVRRDWAPIVKNTQEAVLMAILIEIIGSLMAWMVPTVYANTYNPEQIQLAKNLCYIFMSTTAIGVISDVFKGCALGNERFIFYYILQTVQHILRFALIVVLLNIGLGAIELAAADLVVAAVILAILLFYTLFILNEY